MAELDGSLLLEPVNGIMTDYFWTGHLLLHYSSQEYGQL